MVDGLLLAHGRQEIIKHLAYARQSPESRHTMLVTALHE